MSGFNIAHMAFLDCGDTWVPSVVNQFVCKDGADIKDLSSGNWDGLLDAAISGKVLHQNLTNSTNVEDIDSDDNYVYNRDLGHGNRASEEESILIEVINASVTASLSSDFYQYVRIVNVSDQFDLPIIVNNKEISVAPLKEALIELSN